MGNGRNHLALKNALMQQMGYMTQPFLAGQYPTAMNSGFVAFPPAAAHGFIPHSPAALQSPYLTSPLAQINPAMMSFLAAQSPTSADQQSVAAAIQAANSNAGITSESTVQSSMLPAAMCPSQFTQHTQAAQQQQQQHAVMAAAAAQQQLQLSSQPPGLTSKNKGDPRVE